MAVNFAFITEQGFFFIIIFLFFSYFNGQIKYVEGGYDQYSKKVILHASLENIRT